MAKTKRKNKAEHKMYSIDWLYDLFGQNPDFQAFKIGSNVIDVVVPTLNDMSFAEGGAIRLIAHILVDSCGKVKVCSAKKDSNGTVHYHLSTGVK